MTLVTTRLEVISNQQIDDLHQASLKILNETGIVFKSEEAVEIFKNHGARTEGNLVFITEKMGSWIGDHIGLTTASGRVMLGILNSVSSVTGDRILEKSGNTLRKITAGKAPRWSPHMPKPQSQIHFTPKRVENNFVGEVVYFPSCINRTMGGDSKSPQQKSLLSLTEQLIIKAGFNIQYPQQIEDLCCGLSFDSKGLKNTAMKKSKQLEQALMVASKDGKLPILCDMSPCLLHMKEILNSNLTLVDPIEFSLNYLVPNLQIKKQPDTIVLHTTCSAKKMALENDFLRLAHYCAENVILLDTNCCGFAGDKGFTTPELNQHGLKIIRHQIPSSVKKGYSTSRTCEIGLSEKGGIPFQSILYLLDEVSEKKSTL
jgi:D-lactate dehydrogenase